MYAIIEEGGGQRVVRKDEVILVDLLEHGEVAPGKSITFDKVLCIGPGDGTAAAKVGAPYVVGASVTCEILDPEVKGEKLFIHKFRRRKGYRRKTGHRQRYSQVKVTAIQG